MDIPNNLPKYMGLIKILILKFIDREKFIYHTVCNYENPVDVSVDSIDDFNDVYLGCTGCRFIRKPILSMEKYKEDNAVLYKIKTNWRPSLFNWFRRKITRYEI